MAPDTDAGRRKLAIQRADPKTRRRAVAALFLGLAAAALVYVAASRWMSSVLALEPAEARRALAGALRWMTAGLSVLVVAFGAYLFAFGRKIVKFERFPPPGAAVIKDTEVLEGSRARKRGMLIQVVSALLIVTALALPWVAFQMAARIA